MLKLLKTFDQGICRVSKSCNLRCGYCSIWKDDSGVERYSKELTKLINNHTVFNVFPRKKILNIVGAEPFEFPELPKLLSYLKHHQKDVRVWTNAVFPIRYFQQVLRCVDQWFIYYPTSNANQYIDITGTDGFEQVNEAIDFLKSLKRKVTLNVPVLPQNVSLLPEIYEMVYKKKLEMCLTLSEQEDLTTESKQYVRRFKKIPNVIVYELKKRAKHHCPAFPMDQSNDVKTRVGYTVKQLLHSLKLGS